MALTPGDKGRLSRSALLDRTGPGTGVLERGKTTPVNSQSWWLDICVTVDMSALLSEIPSHNTTVDSCSKS